MQTSRIDFQTLWIRKRCNACNKASVYRLPLLNCAALLFLIVLNACSNPNNPFSLAKRGDLEGVRNYLIQGGSINSKDRAGNTLLVFAAMSGNADLVAYLLEKGANAQEAYSDGTTPLHYASKAHHTEVIKILLKAGASPNLFADNYVRNYTENNSYKFFPFEGTPLHWAIGWKQMPGESQDNKIAAIQALFDGDANPELIGKHCKKAASYIAALNDPKVDAILMNRNRTSNKPMKTTEQATRLPVSIRFRLFSGELFDGEPLSFTDKGVIFRLASDGHVTSRVAWTNFSHEALNKLAKYPQAKRFANPLLQDHPEK